MKNLHQKINDIQKEVRSVFRGSRVAVTEYRSYTAVSHDDIAALLHLPMADAGVSVEVSMESCEIDKVATTKEYQGKKEEKISYMAKVWMLVSFVNSDDPKLDRFTVRSFAYALDSGDKAVGKACSMAVKYVYLKNFNLESTDDEEARNIDPGEVGRSVSSPYKTTEQPRQQTNEAPATTAQILALKKMYPDKDLSKTTKSEAQKLFDAYKR